MSDHRFFVDVPLLWEPGARVTLPLGPADAHHAVKVLRIAAGETVEIVSTANGAGYVVELGDEHGSVARAVDRAAAAVHRVVVAPDGVLLGRVVRALDADDSQPQVVLVQGVAKGEKMDLIVRQAVEVGCVAVIPLLTERSVVKLDPSKRVAKAQRWSRIARSAAEQAHRRSIPEVATPLDGGAFLARAADFERIVVLWEDAEHSAAYLDEVVARWDHITGRVALVVGPEGGLSASEVEALIAAGAQVATLGSSVLRTETAAIVGSALLIHELRRQQRNAAGCRR